MGINLSVPAANELKPRILVIGVGGAGGNAVNNMINSALEGVEFLVANTDAQALTHSLCERRIQLGSSITQGLGAGARPEIGRAAAEEALDQLIENLQGSHMAFITAGMGGGTGTGAAPVVARAARELGILTVGVVTKPFQFEGSRRLQMAEAGVEELQQYVDTLIIIPNQNLFRIANEKTTFADAFKMADNVLHAGVRGVTDLMVMPGLINLDFADVRTVMSEMGKAMMGTGEAEGQNRALQAAEAAIANPLLDDVSMKGARGVLINITGGMDLTLYEVDEAANRIRSEVDPDANIIVGSTFNEQLQGKMRVSVVATGIDVATMMQQKPSAVVTPIRMPPRAVPTPTAAAASATASAPASAPRVEPAMTAPSAPVMAAPSVQAPVPQAMVTETAAERSGHSHFLPPRPAEPVVRREPSLAAPAVPAAEKPAPEAVDDRPSLFGRVFGGMTATKPAARPQPASTTVQAEADKPAAVSAAKVEPPMPPKTAELPIDPIDRPVERREDDLLDIPTFLRRQAN